MPNHVATNLVVSGDIDDVTSFVNGARDPDGRINICAHYPMPEELKYTTKGYGPHIDNSNDASLIEKYGAANWYDWCIQNWGSKWGTYEHSDWNIERLENQATATIYYQTAWSPITDYYLTVSKMFPLLTFFHEFADEGGNFVGSKTIKNGEIIETNDCEWDSEDGIAIREAVGYYYPEDEEQDDENE